MTPLELVLFGAACYHFLIGDFEFAATQLSKTNMLVQIAFCTLVLAAQVTAWIPAIAITAASAAVLFIAGASGFDYVMKWSIKAIQHRRQMD